MVSRADIKRLEKRLGELKPRMETMQIITGVPRREGDGPEIIEMRVPVKDRRSKM